MGNYSRNTFNQLKHYVGVRLQQGVPLVDADWNEREDIWKHQLRNVVKNIVGDGVPKDNDGFKIIPVAGEDNNFAVKGGTNNVPGMCYVDGWEVLIESDVKYLDQVLYTDSSKAADWGVTALSALSAPSGGEQTDSVYLDVWEWEVDSADDSDLVNPSIDVETCLRLKREWVVRVAVNTTDLPDAPDGHSYYKLAEITRRAGQDAILEADIADKRRIGLALPDHDFLDTITVKNGNVGIGTADPALKLAVGDDDTGLRHRGENELAVVTGNTDRMRFAADGKIGIGTPDPAVQLAIGDDDTGFQQQGENELAVYTGNSERLRVDSGGNVGIGTDDPTKKLDVRGSGTFGEETWSHVLRTTGEEDSSHLGNSVSMEGDWLIAGSHGVPDATYIGAAILYKKNNLGAWEEKQKLLSDNQSTASYFGRCVVLSGNQAFVGAIDDNNGGTTRCGAVYVFEKADANDTWSKVQVLCAGDKQTDDKFGFSIAVHGNTAVIGARWEATQGSCSGSAYIFEKGADNRWAQTHKINPILAASHRGFGDDVSIHGDRVLVSAAWEDSTYSDSGAVYVFEKETDANNNIVWTEKQKIKSPAPAGSTFFGWSISLEGDVAVIGEPDRVRNGAKRGQAYIYEKEGDDWVFKSDLLPTKEFYDGNAGWFVLVKDGYVYMGMAGAAEQGWHINVGHVQMYKKTGGNWGLEQVFSSDGGTAGDNFGSSIAISGNVMAVGAYYEDLGRGTVHIFEKDGEGHWRIPDRTNGCLDLKGMLSFSGNNRKLIHVPGTNFEIGAQKNTQYYRTGKHFAWYKDNQMAMHLKDGKLAVGVFDPGGDHLDVRGSAYSYGWNSNNADYAEYFESSGGKAIPPGTAVVIGQNGKIRPAKKDETPIGIISCNPSVVGNSPKEWPGKYLCDDFGRPLTETYEEEITKEDGTKEKVTYSQPKLNPDYDREKEYIPRNSGDRPEWNCVGLLGQLPLLKGQPTAPTWIKIKNISKKTDLWLVK